MSSNWRQMYSLISCRVMWSTAARRRLLHTLSARCRRGGVVDGLMASAVPKSDSSMGDDIYSVLPRLLLLSPIFLDDGLVVEILTPVRGRLWEIVCLRAGWN